MARKTEIEVTLLAEKVLAEHQLPITFSHRQAFILGYRLRRKLEFRVLYENIRRKGDT